MRARTSILLLVTLAAAIVGYQPATSQQQLRTTSFVSPLATLQKRIVKLRLSVRLENGQVDTEVQDALAVYPQTILTPNTPRVFGASRKIVVDADTGREIPAVPLTFNSVTGLASLLLTAPLSFKGANALRFTEYNPTGTSFVITPESVETLPLPAGAAKSYVGAVITNEAYEIEEMVLGIVGENAGRTILQTITSRDMQRTTQNLLKGYEPPVVSSPRPGTPDQQLPAPPEISPPVTI